MTISEQAPVQPPSTGIRVIPLLDVLKQARNWNAVCDWLNRHADDTRCRMYWKVPPTVYFVRRGEPPMYFGYSAPVDQTESEPLPPVGAPVPALEYLRLDSASTRQVVQQAYHNGTYIRRPVQADRFLGGLRLVSRTQDLGCVYRELYPIELFVSALDQRNGNARASAEFDFTSVYIDAQICLAISDLLLFSPDTTGGGTATDNVHAAFGGMSKQRSQTINTASGLVAEPLNIDDPDKGQSPEDKSTVETGTSSAAAADDDSNAHVHGNDAILERSELAAPTDTRGTDHPSGITSHSFGGSAIATASSDTRIYAPNQQMLNVQVFVNNAPAPHLGNPTVEPPNRRGKDTDAENRSKGAATDDMTGASQASTGAHRHTTAATLDDDPYELKGKADAVYALYWVAHQCSANPEYTYAPNARTARKEIAAALLSKFIDDHPALRRAFGKTRMEQTEKFIDPGRDPNAGLHSGKKKTAWLTHGARQVLMEDDPQRPEFMNRRAGENHLPELATLLLIIDATKQWLGWPELPPAGDKSRVEKLDALLDSYNLGEGVNRKTLFPIITWNRASFVPAPKR